MAGLLRRAAFVVLVLIVAAAGWVAYHLRDRNAGYALDLCLTPSVAPITRAPSLRVGFARENITPDLSRTVWLAGFANGRQATTVHDDLWAVAVAIDDGEHSLALVVLDAIGLFHDDVIAIRRKVERTTRFDYVVVASTHDHSAPDLMGLWGRRTGFSGVDDTYRTLVIDRAARAVVSAGAAREPADLSLLELPMNPTGLVADTRPPHIFDSTIRVMHFTRPADGTTVGSVVNWANHPETPWSNNTEITADFPGYLRDALANGIGSSTAGLPPAARSPVPGLGGLHVYVNGAIGGLMTTSPETTVTDPFTGDVYDTPSHDKARAVARRLGEAILSALSARVQTPTENPRLTILARTLELPVDNLLFRLALSVGTIDRGQSRVNHVRTEMGLVSIGDASIALVPGELYPEIANGGIVRPIGADFEIDPLEVPPWRHSMPGRVKFLVGLANDEIGYIIPKSEWDNRAPWLDGASRRPYGEQISLGPDTAPLLHEAFTVLTHRSLTSLDSGTSRSRASVSR